MAQVLRRSLRAGGPVLDAVRGEDGRLRVFFGAGTQAAIFDPKPALGAVVLEEAHEIGGSVLLVGRGEGFVALKEGPNLIIGTSR